eukprot:4563560-Prymnesium_polylepis.1
MATIPHSPRGCSGMWVCPSSVPLACFVCVAGLASSVFASGLRVRSVVVPRAASGVGLAVCAPIRSKGLEESLRKVQVRFAVQTHLGTHVCGALPPQGRTGIFQYVYGTRRLGTVPGTYATPGARCTGMHRV